MPPQKILYYIRPTCLLQCYPRNAFVFWYAFLYFNDDTATSPAEVGILTSVHDLEHCIKYNTRALTKSGRGKLVNSRIRVKI